MKFLFFLLLILNAVFLTWRSGWDPVEWFGPGETVQRLVLPQEGASMWDNKTADGVPPEQEKPEERFSAVSEAVPVDPVSVTLSENGCYEMGPVHDRAAADNFVHLLSSNARDVNVATRAGSIPGGWWVLYPRASGLETARSNRRMLESKGVIDTWLFESGSLRGAISLGFYKSREEAEQVLKQFMDKGITAKITPRLVRGDAFWVRFSWEGLPQDLEENVRVLNSQDAALRMPLPSPCKL